METVTATTDDELIETAMQAADGPSPAQEDSHKPASAEPHRTSSPALKSLDQSRRPRPATVCEDCPNSVWFTSPTEVKCYCRVMYLVTWSVKEPNQITACDGMFIERD